ncbi:MAG: hypothetical protein U1D66_04685 [Erythrobacter sp.]|nr:hypothetical protein [Erythrobacter sp.]MDZ4393982.1 hypothetical protein [Cypionkella sp.]
MPVGHSFLQDCPPLPAMSQKSPRAAVTAPFDFGILFVLNQLIDDAAWTSTGDLIG